MLQAVLLIAGSLFVADAAEDAKKEIEKLQGKWSAVEAEKDGEKAPENERKQIGLTFKGDKLTLHDRGRADEIGFKLDPSKKLKTIDLTLGKDTVKGIYSLDGDNLKICIRLGAAEYPTEFTGKKGHSLVVLKRDKK
jgi:uncharacterized protein (TIGR03067 family)